MQFSVEEELVFFEGNLGFWSQGGQKGKINMRSGAKGGGHREPNWTDLRPPRNPLWDNEQRQRAPASAGSPSADLQASESTSTNPKFPSRNRKVNHNSERPLCEVAGDIDFPRTPLESSAKRTVHP